ncbi:MAG: dockerin type I domain-containing protein [Candidatus Poribacteria bacterium]|nr:dockerin type I domain-containing protein [Candidatus Poribacteria bacterium]
MKKLICLLLISSLVLLVSTVGYAQDTDPDTLRAADVNTDGVINILDLTLVASHFGETPTADQSPNPDVNGDGTVNILDLTLVASHFGKAVPPPVVFVSTPLFLSADPATNSQLDVNDAITVTFDKTPEDVTVSTGVAIVDGKIVTITGPFTAGPLALTITWSDGTQTQTLTYTVKQPVAFVGVDPRIDSELTVNDTITFTFDSAPDDVTVNAGIATIDGKIVTIKGPFTPGPLNLTISWNDGSLTFTYTVAEPDTGAPDISSGTVSDGDKDVDAKAINDNARIEIEFSEAVSGNIALQTAAGVDIGWLGKVEGNKGILELVTGKELGNEITYIIAGKVKDAAGNSTDINITFTTASKTSGIPFEVTDATFDSLVLGSEVPIVLEYIKDG